MSRITLPHNSSRMPALSIRQPWAWLIVNGFKPIENRDWPTKFRGEFLVHAGSKMTMDDYDAAMLFIEGFVDSQIVAQVPDPGELQRGGVVGMATLVDCVTEHPSLWFTGGQRAAGADAGRHPGGYGFVLANAKPLPFIPWKGRLGFFDVVVRP